MTEAQKAAVAKLGPSDRWCVFRGNVVVVNPDEHPRLVKPDGAVIGATDRNLLGEAAVTVSRLPFAIDDLLSEIEAVAPGHGASITLLVDMDAFHAIKGVLGEYGGVLSADGMSIDLRGVTVSIDDRFDPSDD